MFKWLFALPVLLFMMVACGIAGSASRAESPFWDGAADVRGSDSLLSWDKNATFGEVVGAANAVVRVRIEGIKDVELPSADHSNIIYVDPSEKESTEQMFKMADSVPVNTTYSGTVESWIKGGGDSTILVTGLGGVSSYDGKTYYPDGFFLLEPGRSYLLLLIKDDRGNYSYDSGREAFDITDGVKVLNNPITRDLEHFEDMSVDNFVSYVRQAATAGGAEASPQPVP